ncbi:uncharacterized protein TNCV_4736691 [Trichonephila clavipes]|nr:uncharacterized protein TNCV_4736691 [Trichonephila clavipes]
MEKNFQGRHFVSSDEVKIALQEPLREAVKIGHQLCFKELYERCQKCIVTQGNYFEGRWASVLRTIQGNGDRYRAMITNFFIPELNYHDVQELWFQQDGATCHTARATIDLLKDTFGDRLISRFGPENWPLRSCDLTPLDYFLGLCKVIGLCG